MKKFFIKSLFIIIPILAFGFYFEYKLGKIPNSYNTKRKNLENQLGSIKVIVLGSSQSLYGINPEYFSVKGFNLGNITQSFFYDSHITLKYIDKMPKLKCVLINITYSYFGHQICDSIESWRDYYYFQFWDIKYPELKEFDLRFYSKIFLYTPSKSFLFAKDNFKINLAEGFSSNGWARLDTTNNFKNLNDSLGLERATFFTTNYKKKRFAENYKYLENLIKELKNRNIEPVFITTPLLSTIYKYFNNEIQFQSDSAVKNLCQKYHCQSYNYTKDVRFVARDFNDNDHLNFIGAKKFSKILNDEVLHKIFE